MASRNPYHVKELQTSDVSDWKQLARERSVLRVRTSEEGEVIDWTKFMSIKLMVSPRKNLYKTSHLQERFSTINLDLNRRKSNLLSGLLVRAIERPKIRKQSTMICCHSVLVTHQSSFIRSTKHFLKGFHTRRILRYTFLQHLTLQFAVN